MVRCYSDGSAQKPRAGKDKKMGSGERKDEQMRTILRNLESRNPRLRRLRRKCQLRFVVRVTSLSALGLVLWQGAAWLAPRVTEPRPIHAARATGYSMLDLRYMTCLRSRRA